MNSATLTIESIEELIERRKWILKMINEFEGKYHIKSSEFYEKWSKKLIPEPEDPEIHGDFMIWAGLIEELQKIENELINTLKRDSNPRKHF